MAEIDPVAKILVDLHRNGGGFPNYRGLHLYTHTLAGGIYFLGGSLGYPEIYFHSISLLTGFVYKSSCKCVCMSLCQKKTKHST